MQSTSNAVIKANAGHTFTFTATILIGPDGKMSSCLTQLHRMCAAAAWKLLDRRDLDLYI